MDGKRVLHRLCKPPHEVDEVHSVLVDPGGQCAKIEDHSGKGCPYGQGAAPIVILSPIDPSYQAEMRPKSGRISAVYDLIYLLQLSFSPSTAVWAFAASMTA